MKTISLDELRVGLADVGVPESELEALASQCMVLPDYKGNPRVATPEEMLALVRESYPAHVRQGVFA